MTHFADFVSFLMRFKGMKWLDPLELLDLPKIFTDYGVLEQKMPRNVEISRDEMG